MSFDRTGASEYTLTIHYIMSIIYIGYPEEYMLDKLNEVAERADHAASYFFKLAIGITGTVLVGNSLLGMFLTPIPDASFADMLNMSGIGMACLGIAYKK